MSNAIQFGKDFYGGPINIGFCGLIAAFYLYMFVKDRITLTKRKNLLGKIPQLHSKSDPSGIYQLVGKIDPVSFKNMMIERTDGHGEINKSILPLQSRVEYICMDRDGNKIALPSRMEITSADTGIFIKGIDVGHFAPRLPKTLVGVQYHRPNKTGDFTDELIRTNVQGFINNDLQVLMVKRYIYGIESGNCPTLRLSGKYHTLGPAVEPKSEVTPDGKIRKPMKPSDPEIVDTPATLVPIEGSIAEKKNHRITPKIPMLGAYVLIFQLVMYGIFTNITLYPQFVPT